MSFDCVAPSVQTSSRLAPRFGIVAAFATSYLSPSSDCLDGNILRCSNGPDLGITESTAPESAARSICIHWLSETSDIVLLAYVKADSPLVGVPSSLFLHSLANYCRPSSVAHLTKSMGFSITRVAGKLVKYVGSLPWRFAALQSSPRSLLSQ